MWSRITPCYILLSTSRRSMPVLGRPCGMFVSQPICVSRLAFSKNSRWLCESLLFRLLFPARSSEGCMTQLPTGAAEDVQSPRLAHAGGDYGCADGNGTDGSTQPMQSHSSEQGVISCLCGRMFTPPLSFKMFIICCLQGGWL